MWGRATPSAPGHTWQCLDTFLVVTAGQGVLLASGESRPRWSLNIYSAQDSPATKNCLTQTSIMPRMRSLLKTSSSAS